MKAKEKLKDLIREVINLIKKFFKPYGIKDEMLIIPANIKKMEIKVEVIHLSMTIFALIFAFMLRVTNMLIEYKLILLGIIVFMLYRSQEVLREGFFIFEDSEREKFQIIFEDEVVYRGCQIIGKTLDRVLKYDESSKLYKIMSNES